MNLIRYEGNHTAEYLLSEGEGNISREAITLAAGPALPPGQVLGFVAATGLHVPFDEKGKDGSEIAAAVLYAWRPASDQPRPAAGHVRLCEVSAQRLTGLTAKAAADLSQHAVIVRY